MSEINHIFNHTWCVCSEYECVGFQLQMFIKLITEIFEKLPCLTRNTKTAIDIDTHLWLQFGQIYRWIISQDYSKQPFTPWAWRETVTQHWCYFTFSQNSTEFQNFPIHSETLTELQCPVSKCQIPTQACDCQCMLWNVWCVLDGLAWMCVSEQEG